MVAIVLVIMAIAVILSPAPLMPTLIVLRHSKAASPLGTADIDRPLADTRPADAETVGDQLRAAKLTPDHVICSTALRTRQTLEGLALDGPPVDFEPAGVRHDAEEILDLLREQSTPETLLLDRAQPVDAPARVRAHRRRGGPLPDLGDGGHRVRG